MIFDLDNEYDRAKFDEYISNMRNGGGLVEVKRKKPLRTLSQNSYLHLILSYFASEYGCTTDEAKVEYYKKTANRELYEREVTNKHGKKIVTLRSSTELTTSEMALSITRFLNWSASVAGIMLPSAGDDRFLAYASQCIERNREYL